MEEQLDPQRNFIRFDHATPQNFAETDTPYLNVITRLSVALSSTPCRK